MLGCPQKCLANSLSSNQFIHDQSAKLCVGCLNEQWAFKDMKPTYDVIIRVYCDEDCVIGRILIVPVHYVFHQASP
jgi:hypothetical protein